MSAKEHAITITTITSSSTSTSSREVGTSKKRKADAIGRLEATTSIPLQGGRGSDAGWTKCPLCNKYSAKVFAMGRGIAAHLHAVHTPWKATKMANKIKRRTHETSVRKKARLREPAALAAFQPLKPWDPTDEEIQNWEHKVLQVIQQLEKTNKKSSELKQFQMSKKLDRYGGEAVSYKDSLPAFIRAAADGCQQDLKVMLDVAAEQYTTRQDKSVAIISLLDTRDRNLSTAEHWAAGSGHLAILKFLLEMRSSNKLPRVQDECDHAAKVGKKIRRRDGKTPLHYASRNGHLKCVEFLLDNQGHHVDERSGDGTTPLHMACFGGHQKLVEYLLERGADIQASNEWGCSAAHWVAMTINKDASAVHDLCHFIQAKGVSFCSRQKHGHSAVHKAAQRKNASVILWMANRAGLSETEKNMAGEVDEGGHKPSEIWKSIGGDKAALAVLLSNGW